MDSEECAVPAGSRSEAKGLPLRKRDDKYVQLTALWTRYYLHKADSEAGAGETSLNYDLEPIDFVFQGHYHWTARSKVTPLQQPKAACLNAREKSYNGYRTRFVSCVSDALQVLFFAFLGPVCVCV